MDAAPRFRTLLTQHHLNTLEGFLVNNSFMVTFDIILRKLALVLLFLFRDNALRTGSALTLYQTICTITCVISAAALAATATVSSVFSRQASTSATISAAAAEGIEPAE